MKVVSLWAVVIVSRRGRWRETEETERTREKWEDVITSVVPSSSLGRGTSTAR